MKNTHHKIYEEVYYYYDGKFHIQTIDEHFKCHEFDEFLMKLNELENLGYKIPDEVIFSTK